MKFGRGKLIGTFLEDKDIARLDALAEQHGVTREVMLSMIVDSGLRVHEEQNAMPESQRRLVGGAS